MRNAQLDGLRGYAATAVIFYHCLGPVALDTPRLLEASFNFDILTRTFVAIFNGDTAVSFFFILSGAVLMNSLMQQNGRAPLFALDFVVQRLFRIYPALLVCIAVACLAWSAIGQPMDLQSVLRNIILYDTIVIGPSWTLNAEMFAIPLILVGFFSYRAFGLRAFSPGASWR